MTLAFAPQLTYDLFCSTFFFEIFRPRLAIRPSRKWIPLYNWRRKINRKEILATPCSKRKYTLCFPVSTQNVPGAGRPAVLRDSQSEFPNNQATVCEEIPNGSKFLRESLLGCCVRKFTKICFCHWLLCYCLIKCIPSNFDSELWNHLEIFHKLSFVWRGTSMSYPPYPLTGPTWCRFWVLTHQNSKCILSFGVECTLY